MHNIHDLILLTDGEISVFLTGKYLTDSLSGERREVVRIEKNGVIVFVNVPTCRDRQSCGERILLAESSKPSIQKHLGAVTSAVVKNRRTCA